MRSRYSAFFEIRYQHSEQQQAADNGDRRSAGEIQRRSRAANVLRGGQKDDAHQNAFDSKRRGGGANDRDSKRPGV